jgi:hypothetical protein
MPKYVHGLVSRVASSSLPYGAFARAYPSQMATLNSIFEKDQASFSAVSAGFPVILFLSLTCPWD